MNSKHPAGYFDGAVLWPDEERYREAEEEPVRPLYGESDGRAPAEWAALAQRIHETNERRTPEEWAAIRAAFNRTPATTATADKAISGGSHG